MTDMTSYSARHQRVRYHRGAANLLNCETCEERQAYEWAQTKDTDGESIWDYTPMCRSCHTKYDRKDFSHVTPVKGEQHGHHKLTEDEVHKIRILLKQGKTQQSIAYIYGVHQMTISRIKRGEIWGWLKEEVDA